MHGSSEKSLLERFGEALRAHGVEFIIIGGQAEVVHGGSRVTYDVGFCYKRSPENLRRLAAALRDLNPTLRGAPEGPPFRADEKTLSMGCNFTFRTPIGGLDLLGHVEPLGGYEELAREAETCELGGLRYLVAGVDDLIRIKRHIRREKDAESLAQLLAIKRLREEGQSRS